MRFLYCIFIAILLSCSSSTNLENVQQINPQLFSGSAPESLADFNYLRSLGIRSMISVDGAVPMISEASSAGLLYRHVPYGYGGISREDQAKLIKAFSELPKPVYIHCHHGRHRAPTGAAVILKNLFSWDSQRSVKMMKSSGTSKGYKGLYETVLKGTMIPEHEWRRSSVTENAEVDATAREMAVIDRHWDELREISENSWRDSERAAHEVLVLRESFFELDRLNTNHYMSYEKILKAFRGLENSLEKGSPESLTVQLIKIKSQCKNCHKKFRD